MASTFSSSLKLTLIGDGDQSGIWGQTTNTNLGTLVEQAITGVTTIAMSDANYTLSNFNGVLNEARNAVLVVTGANTAVRDVIPPVVKKLYTVVNNTSGGFAIRIIGATGTGVNIPNGAVVPVYCDGIDFYVGLAAAVEFGGTGRTNLTASNVILGNGSDGVQFVAPGTSGNVLTSNGTTWVSDVFPVFPVGTRMTFNQTSAPTGWTKDTGTNNAGFRLVSGTVGSGGSVDFTTAFTAARTVSVTSVSGSAGATTLSTPQIPSHSHVLSVNYGYVPGNPLQRTMQGPVSGVNAPFTSNTTGGGGSHDHPFSFSSGAGTVDLAIKYVDLIIAQKN